MGYHCCFMAMKNFAAEFHEKFFTLLAQQDEKYTRAERECWENTIKTNSNRNDLLEIKFWFISGYVRFMVSCFHMLQYWRQTCSSKGYSSRIVFCFHYYVGFVHPRDKRYFGSMTHGDGEKKGTILVENYNIHFIFRDHFTWNSY